MICCPHCRRSFLLPARTKRPEIATVQQVVAEFFKVEMERLWSKDQRKDIALPRHVACYCLRILTPIGLAQIGEAFDRSHHTVVSSIQRVKDWRDTDPAFKQQLLRVVTLCSEALA